MSVSQTLLTDIVAGRIGRVDEEELVQCPTCQGAGRVPASKLSARSRAITEWHAQRKAAGLPSGRPAGARDKPGTVRQNQGNLDRWAPGGARRVGQQQRDAAKSWTVPELRDLARQAGLRGISRMTHGELVQALTSAGVEIAPRQKK